MDVWKAITEMRACTERGESFSFSFMSFSYERKKSDGIEYFDTQTFSIKVLAKAWLKREEDRLEKNPEHLSTQKVGKSDQGEFRFDGRDYFVVTF